MNNRMFNGMAEFDAQIAIEALEQWRGGPVEEWEERLCRMSSDKANIPSALEAYCLGDRLGAPWESNTAHWSPVEYLTIVKRSNAYPMGTDEADTVRCFQSFTDSYDFDDDIEKLLVCWARFHTKQRRATSYGGTWRDYFATVEALDKKGNLTADRLFVLADDRKPGGSAGNGCLALTLPVYDYAQKIGLPPVRLVQSFFRISHSSEHALGCAEFLCSLFDVLLYPKNEKIVTASCKPIRWFFADKEWEMPPEVFAQKYPNNLLCCYTVTHALYAAFRTRGNIWMIRDVVSMGGDVDSVLALAMMLFRLFYLDRVDHGRWQSLSLVVK
jgi:hypothetical protein